MECGNNIDLITNQEPPKQTKKKKKVLIKKADFPYKARKLFGLEEGKDDKK